MEIGFIEWMALIVILISLIKIITLLVKPRAWVGVIKVVYAKPVLTILLSLVLGVWVLFRLLDIMSIVQIFAAMLFFMLLMVLSVAIYQKETIGFAARMLKDRRLIKKSWLPILVWLILIGWVIKEIFI